MDEEEASDHVCCKTRGIMCEICNEAEFDPRSYCHSICASPKRVCGKQTCSKSTKTTLEKRDGVCVLKRECAMKRRYELPEGYGASLIPPEGEESDGDSLEVEETQSETPEDDEETFRKFNDLKSPEKNTKKGARSSTTKTTEGTLRKKGTPETKRISTTKLVARKESLGKQDGGEAKEETQETRRGPRQKEGEKLKEESVRKKDEEGRPKRVAKEAKDLKSERGGMEEQNEEEEVDEEYEASIHSDLVGTRSDALAKTPMEEVCAMAGAEICTCCECEICQCNLKNVAIETLQKTAVANLQAVKPDTGSARSAEDSKTKRSKAKYDSGSQHERDSNTKDPKVKYEWSFDYFSTPNMKDFEERQRLKDEELKLLSIEEEKMLKLKFEREQKKLAQKQEERSRETAVSDEQDMVDIGSKFYGKPQSQATSEDITSGSIVADTVEGWKKLPEDTKEWQEYKEAEWGGIRHQRPSASLSGTSRSSGSVPTSQKTSIGSSTAKNLQDHPKHKIVLRSTVDKADRKVELQKSPFESPWTEGSARGSISEWVDSRPLMSHKTKKTTADALTDQEQGSITSSWPSADIKAAIPEMAPRPVPRRPPTAAETIESLKSESIAEEPSREVKEEVEEGKASEHSEKSEESWVFQSESRPPGAKWYDDECACLPGFCTCLSKHYVFKKEVPERDTADVGIGFIPLQVDKVIPSTRDGREQMKLEEDRTRELGLDDSCSCIHSEISLMSTPKNSRVDTTTRASISVKLVAPVASRTKKYENTVIIIKPEALKYKDVILRAIKEEGLDIIDQRMVRLSPEQVSEIYTENYGSAYFAMFVRQLSCSPILVLSVAGIDAIKRWNEAVGPERKISKAWFYPSSIKRRFVIHKDIYEVMRFTDDFVKARAELRYFFPLDIIDPIWINTVEVQDYCDKCIHPTLLKGLCNLVRKKPKDPLLFLAEWLLINNPFQPYYKQIHVALAPT